MQIYRGQLTMLEEKYGFKRHNFHTGVSDKVVPKFDALFHDRDTKQYPAWKDVYSRHSERHDALCYVDEKYLIQLFLPFDTDGRPRGFFSITNDEAGNQLQERINKSDFERMKSGLREMRCLTLNPPGTGFAPTTGTSGDPNELPFQFAFKLPVCDLVVDFGDAKSGPRLITIGNVRPAIYCMSGAMIARMPHFSDHEFEIIEPDVQEKPADSHISARHKKAKKESGESDD